MKSTLEAPAPDDTKGNEEERAAQHREAEQRAVRPFITSAQADAVAGAETFTPEEARERAKREITDAIDAWVREHLPEGKAWNQRVMQNLLLYLGKEQAKNIDLIVSQMKDPKLFPGGKRPTLRLHEGGDDMARVIIYGWRDEDPPEHGMTVVHDHGLSKGAVYVHEGAIQETAYGVDRKEWEAKVRGGEETFDLALTNTGTSTVQSGSVKSFTYPFLHTVGGDPAHKHSFSLHAYHPPLKPGDLATFTIDDVAQKLVFIERE
ncbi:hypothetical protein HY374_01005 [Candidatus Berkelbacteria bacterium]|nr:hypothetical protein [Candidatus Berkelbacteria bacterium]